VNVATATSADHASIVVVRKYQYIAQLLRRKAISLCLGVQILLFVITNDRTERAAVAGDSAGRYMHECLFGYKRINN
jgi:hypothetical protein